ncbi:MAG: LmeA family phospholipid-binding protein [Armatimonadota bacterium]|nr:DUF2993 domain-containing protein [bacterium]MDW8320244.1 LmeA family phospholipid-binding protein [Armatimonadota bacterium]
MIAIDARRAAGIALALLLILSGTKEYTRRLERAAERQILQQLGGSGQVYVDIQPRWGALGALLARAESIRVYASDFRAAQMPFFAEPPIPGWRGKAEKVQIVLEDFYLSGVAVRRLEALIPNVSLDSRAATFRLRIRVFGAGWGAGQVVLDEEGLGEFVKRRLPEVRYPQVRVTPSEIRIVGELAALLTAWRFEAWGQVGIHNGRQVVIENVQVAVEGENLHPAVVQKVVSTLNPVIDLERDLRLGSAFIAERVELGDGFLKLVGRATIPPRKQGENDGKTRR